jgi:hypothetical protein
MGIDVCPILLVDQAACKLHENRRPLFDGFVLVVLAAEHVFVFALTTLLALLAVVPDPERFMIALNECFSMIRRLVGVYLVSRW